MEPLSVEEGQRADCYGLLAGCYYLPDEKLAETLHEFARQSPALAGELCRMLDAADGVEALKIDYSRLFVGPFKLLAPPYGSLYLEGVGVMGESTVNARDLYRQEGLDVLIREAPDHICVELEFMAFLIRREIEEGAGANSNGAAACRQKQKSFLELHLGAWVEGFALKVEEHAHTDFYKGLARITSNFVRSDLQQLREEFGGLRSAEP